MQTAFNQDEELGDLSTVSEQNTYDLLPVGDYAMRCISTELKTSKTGGRYVAATFEVLEPGFEGRRVFDNFNIMHSNPQTVEIALRAIKSWVIAVGKDGDARLTLGLLKELEGEEFIGNVSIEKDKTGQYSDQNRIKKYIAVGTDTSAPAAPTAAPAKAQTKAAGSSAKKPWER